MTRVNHPWQVVTLGEGGVGKTSLIMRYVYNVFSGTQQTTIGSSFVERDVVVEDTTYKLRLWDTAGQALQQCSVRSPQFDKLLLITHPPRVGHLVSYATWFD